MQSKVHLQGQIQDLRQGVSNVNSVCVLVLGAFVLMILSEMSSSSKRNNLDLYDPIGGLSETWGFKRTTRNPSGSATEQHHDKLLLVILKYHYENTPMQHTQFSLL